MNIFARLRIWFQLAWNRRVHAIASSSSGVLDTLRCGGHILFGGTVNPGWVRVDALNSRCMCAALCSLLLGVGGCAVVCGQ